VKVADCWPDGIVTVAGTVTYAVFVFVSVTAAPLFPAGLVRVMVPVDGVLPKTVAGENEIVETFTAAAAA
jgi:hypothetical protein